ncbi:MAG: hypothetical protein MN733_34625 [Nitrososphaera sp.]|nr:hypothetical protein [Nitrososphaera sp.]
MDDKIPFIPSQETPCIQLQGHLMAMRQWVYNLEEGCSKPEKVAEHLHKHLDFFQHFDVYFNRVDWNCKMADNSKERVG